MRTRRIALRWLGAVLVTVLGCQNSPPKLQPAKEPDIIRVPPLDARYDQPYYPKQALPKRDGGRRMFSEMPNPKAGQQPPGVGTRGF